MLANDIERAEKNNQECVIGYGTCGFCGQRAARKVMEYWTQEEKDELATEVCGCKESVLYTAKKDRKKGRTAVQKCFSGRITA